MPPASQSPAPAERAPLISLVFAYYENPSMLALQWKEIAKYPASLKRKIEVIVVDDGSPTRPASEVDRPRNLPSHSIFRIDRDVRWNQDAARNIGAHEARSPWLLLTDMDHVVPQDTLAQLAGMDKNSSVFYTFSRIKFPTRDEREPHPNSYFMTKELYWAIGGHDEDFAGIYGKDFLFRKRAHRHTNEVVLQGAPIARVGSTMVSDAGTRTISRRNSVGQRVWGYLLPGLKALKLWRGVQTLTETYSRVV
jgi:cellulose synthase/poly-beta-1,6-N-acetylglucosamine synthase-like glycosyltransferase